MVPYFKRLRWKLHKNCSTIEPARAAQAENNVTIETVKHIAVNFQAQIAQFGNMMEKLGAINWE